MLHFTRICVPISRVLHASYGLLLWLFLLTGTVLNAQSLPAGFNLVQLSDGLSTPTAMAFAPDGRIFITEQGGTVRIFKDGALLPTPFLELTVDSNGERGLDGITLDPDFASNGYVYLYYTVPGSPAHNRVSRFTANGDVVVAGSETILLDLEPPLYGEFHNGGSMRFGVDGKLYIGIGDHASPLNAQDPDSHWGKLLRINPDGTIPSDNPNQTGSEARQRIWAMGLRNPFTLAVQPVTGRIFVNDVGFLNWEEINDATQPGHNFGWPQAEGVDYNPAFTNPFYTYGHGDGDSVGCAITGGTFFNPVQTSYPAEWTGRYFFHDYCNQWINYLDLSGPTPVRGSFATGIPSSPLGISTGPDGNLYFITRDSGHLYRIIYSDQLAPAITAQPVSVSAFDGQPASFGVSVSGATPITYQWQLNEEDIPTATGSSYTIPSVSSAVAGNYRVIVSNGYGSVTSNTVSLVSLGYNAAPVPDILTPANHTKYTAGTTISFSGTAVDAEDGVLPPSAFTWRVYLYHDTHYHDGPPIATGAASGTFTIPNQGETAVNVWYRLILTVTDSKGLSARDTVDIDPTIVKLTVATNPPGMQINLDGHPHTAPYSQSFVVGMRINLATTGVQMLADSAYEFTEWSPAVPADGYVVIPPKDTTYVASFTVLPDGPRVFTLVQPLYNCQTGALTFRTTGGDGSPIEYMATGITGWTSEPTHIIDAELRSDPGLITLMARQNGVEVSRPFDLTAVCANLPPVVYAVPAPLSATVGMSFSYTVPDSTFADPENGLLAWSATGLPAGLVFNKTTRVLSGTLTQAGSQTIVISVVDPYGASASTTLTLVVSEPANHCMEGMEGPEISSVKDGDWNSPATWSCSCVPAACNPVRIGHRVTVTVQQMANAKKLIYAIGGHLILNEAAMLHLGH
ncbi:PQQ-dependent sugar dehydrogenase [Rudanella lutea]|uniref:PQQ-dependent sugar dehydrogenase n=1 Tax=Rudanella lutea TaxID=451374 RepID=UPI0003655024|nr:PQQ-dependent sugar dehydrogenase [Rudanella lutea]